MELWNVGMPAASQSLTRDSNIPVFHHSAILKFSISFQPLSMNCESVRWVTP